MMLFHKCLRLADICDILKSQSAVPIIGSGNAKLISRSEKKCGKAAKKVCNLCFFLLYLIRCDIMAAENALFIYFPCIITMRFINYFEWHIFNRRQNLFLFYQKIR